MVQCNYYYLLYFRKEDLPYPCHLRGRLSSGDLLDCWCIDGSALCDMSHWLYGWFLQTDPEPQSHGRLNHFHLQDQEGKKTSGSGRWKRCKDILYKYSKYKK